MLQTGILAYHLPGNRSAAVTSAAEAPRGLSLELRLLAFCLRADTCLLARTAHHLPPDCPAYFSLVALRWSFGSHKGCPEYIANPAFSEMS